MKSISISYLLCFDKIWVNVHFLSWKDIYCHKLIFWWIIWNESCKYSSTLMPSVNEVKMRRDQTDESFVLIVVWPVEISTESRR